ncbi:MAG: putative DNA modification/repair radical SAM protein [Clostridia bacterium]|nr:putative DNA modification/repair radical SAM protein [Clostridia bacterium]
MDVFEKLKILTGAAKYDVACTSSGVDRSSGGVGVGNSTACGICHSFSADGRCISLLKILMTNYCIYNCSYCVNRRTNDIQRAAFTPRELADLTMNFYKRNYIEGLFLSSGIIRNPDYTCEQIIATLEILRNEYGFKGYIHAKAIPGASAELLHKLGVLADRMSVNIELPSQKSLQLLAPDKSKENILAPMGVIRDKIRENTTDLVRYNHAPKFAPAGQSTQMIVGATPDTDYQILNLTESLYNKYKLKRVFFSAYMPIGDNPLLPSKDTKPPLLREHRLYQADWLLRFYGFKASELLDEKHQNFNPLVDPKCSWALSHLDQFPVDVNTAEYETLLRVPGIGVNSARRIIIARRSCLLRFEHLKKLGVVLKRAQYFITCSGKITEGLKITEDIIIRNMITQSGMRFADELIQSGGYSQLSLFNDNTKVTAGDVMKCLSGQM